MSTDVIELSETEQPIISTHRQQSVSRRTRKKSFDTSNILYKLPELRTRYYHKDCWTDSDGNVFRCKVPIQHKQTDEAKNNAGKTDICIDNNRKNNNISSKKKNKRMKKILFLEIKIKRISAIDTTSESFRCRFHYYLTWLASVTEYDSFLCNKDTFTPEWSPKIEWTNAAEVHDHFQGSNFTIKTSKSVGFNDEWRIHKKYLGFDAVKGIWNRVRYEADVTFAEELELEAFPFDCQDLSLYMKVEKDNIDACDIVPFPRHGDFVLLDPQFSVLSEWYLENLVTEFGHTDPLKSKSFRCYSLVSVHIKASRRWEAHVGMIIVTFCMFSLGLGTFAQSVHPEQLGERLGFCVTFLLADVATLQLMFVHLPNIPYWTILDFYIYSSFVFLFIITIWSCFAGANYEYLEDSDIIAFWVFLSMYIIIHIAYISFSVYYRRRERSKLNMISSELNKFFLGERSMADKRAISNAWDQDSLMRNDSEHRYDKNDVTSFHFQGAKLETL